jgi:hypothetical protein
MSTRLTRDCDHRQTQGAVDWLRFNALSEMADLAASCWRSVAEAAFREEGATVQFHCRQIAVVTREAFALAKQIGSPSNREDVA